MSGRGKGGKGLGREIAKRLLPELQENFALSNITTALMKLKFAFIFLVLLNQISLDLQGFGIGPAMSMVEKIAFVLDSIFYFFLYYTDLGYFIYRFSITFSAKNLLLPPGKTNNDDKNWDLNIALAAVHRHIKLRRYLVCSVCCLGLVINGFTTCFYLFHVSGFDLRISELLLVVMSISSSWLYIGLATFYVEAKTSKFSLSEDRYDVGESFEAIMTTLDDFMESHCVSSAEGWIQVFPNVSFTLRSTY